MAEENKDQDIKEEEPVSPVEETAPQVPPPEETPLAEKAEEAVPQEESISWEAAGMASPETPATEPSMDNIHQILSQDEVNLLLNSLASGDVKTESDVPTSADGTMNYDFTSQERVMRGRMPTLEIICERCSRSLQTALSGTLRKALEVKTASVEMVKFGEYIKRLPLPSNINIFKMEPLRGSCLVVLDARLIFRFVNQFFGGGGIQGYMKIEGRDFTAIEQRIIKKVLDIFFENLTVAFKPILPITCNFLRAEINPQFVGIVTPTEIVILITFEVEIDANPEKISLCIPYAIIEPIKDKLYGGFQTDQEVLDERWGVLLNKRIKDCSLELNVELGSVVLKLSEINNLKKGDVIILDNDVEAKLTARIEGIPKFAGVPGVSSGNKALKIVSLIEGGEEEDE